MIFIMTNETAADSVFELHVIIHEAADDADVWKKKWMKWSCVNKYQEIMKDWSIDINAHEKNDAETQKMTNNMKLLTCDNQHWMSFCQKAVCVWLQEKNWRNRKEKKEKTKTKNLTKMSDSLEFSIRQEEIMRAQWYEMLSNIMKNLNIWSMKTFW